MSLPNTDRRGFWYTVSPKGWFHFLSTLANTTNDGGIDPDSCTDVLIENCVVNTNDDAIAKKQVGTKYAWQRAGSSNIIVRNVT